MTQWLIGLVPNKVSLPEDKGDHAHFWTVVQNDGSHDTINCQIFCSRFCGSYGHAGNCIRQSIYPISLFHHSKCQLPPSGKKY